MASYSRDELAMRNFLIARAAKDNGADRVILLEPDLYYSAQDRGPRPEHGVTSIERNEEDYKKFDGQPFSARLYADLLREAGVDEVVTVHNHSCSVENIFMDRLSGYFHNLLPFDVYADYMRDSDIVDVDNLVLCSPDHGALSFCSAVHRTMARDRRQDDQDEKTARRASVSSRLPSMTSRRSASGISPERIW